MKRLVLLVSLALLTVVGTTATTQAYYLDTPHNESNGIYCATCHNSLAFKAGEPVDGLIDTTMRNAVCLQCHVAVVTDPKLVNFRGPVKKLHASSSSTLAKFGNWTTECTQCHDVHFQGQLDWASDADVYLATGNISTNNVYSLATKTTTVNIDSVVGPGWDDTSKWSTKGGKAVGTTAVDGSRGLIFVPNTNNPAETFEIVSATAGSVTVKGKMTTALAGQTFGVIYGQSLKSYVLPNGGSTVNDLRAVRFYRPERVAGTFGGYVDETFEAAKPEGLCQVCHSATNNVWKKDGTAQTHNVGTVCTNCHTPVGGFPPAVNHSIFIKPDLAVLSGCNCHSAKVTNPDSGHVAGCTVCHTATRPEINENVMSTEPAGTVLGNLYNGGYSGGTAATGRLKSGALGINDVGFPAITCIDCHMSRTTDHGSHAAGSFAWSNECTPCHGTAGVTEVVAVHPGGCITCHSGASGGSGTSKTGDPANGVDGDATRGISSAPHNSVTCLTCHSPLTAGTAVNAGSIGGIHHDNFNGNTTCATAGCHSAAKVAHTTTVATHADCNSCHDAVVGGSAARLAATAPFVSTGEVHLANGGCTTCHAIAATPGNAGGLKTGTVATLAAGGGTCVTCHGAYFANHQNIDHATSRVTNTVTGCVNCHTSPAVGGARPAITSPFTGAGEVHATGLCGSCHQTNGTLKAAPAKAPGLAANGGSCSTCHVSGASTWTTLHTAGAAANHTAFTVDTNCSGCHTGTAPYIGAGEVHNNLGCATCHDTLTGSLLAPAGRAVAMTAGGCSGCHINGTTKTWVTVHTPITTAAHVNMITTASCVVCHGNTTPVYSGARDAQVAPYIVGGDVHATGCALCHNTTNGNRIAGAKGDASVVAGADSKWECNECHTATWATTHTAANINHAATVSLGTGICGDCHTGTAGNPTVPVNGSDPKVHDTCSTCHVDATGALKTLVEATVTPGRIAAMPNLGTTGGFDGGGDCAACHGATYFTTNHSSVHDARFFYDTVGTGANVDILQANGNAGCAACHNDGGAALATFAAINTEHLGDCNKCHTATRFANGTSGLTVQDLIKARALETTTDTNCRTCHVSNFNNNPTHTNINHFGLGKVTGNAECTGCHDQGAVGTDAQFIDVIHNAIGCGTCHVNSLGSGPLVDKSGGATYASQAKNYEASNPTGGSCITCHDAYGTNFQTGHKPALHANVVGTGTTCIACHTGDSITSALTHNNTCATCHTNLTTDGRLVNGTGASSPYAAVAVGSATTHTFGVASTCATCHATRASNFASHVTQDHSMVGSSTSCASCHTGNIISSTLTHNNTCTTCHTNTSTDGRLVNGTGASSPNGATVVGDASGHVITAVSSCASCHTARATDFTTHLVKDHTGVTGTTDTTLQSNDCNDCHSGTVASATGADEHAQNCVNCHTNTGNNGTLVSGAVNAGSYGGTAINVGSAASHTLGSTSTCLTCHPSDYFSNTATLKHVSNTHSVAIDGDLSGGQLCSGCHTGYSENWTNILAKHDMSATNPDACKVCHDSTRTVNVAAPRTSVQDVITFNSGTTNVVSCLECHSDKSAGHGGHAATDFGWTAATGSTPTCGNAACHNAAVNTDVVMDIHGGTCTLCHTSSTGGNGTTKVGARNNGDATKGDTTTPHLSICTVCHNTVTITSGGIHHDTAPATGNNCVTCHAANASTLSNLANLPANHDTTVVAAATSCITSGCHLTAGVDGTTTAMPVSTTDGLMHSACVSCHTFTTGTLAGTLRAVPNTKGVGAMPVTGGVCTNCHNATPIGNIHHGNANALSGACERCHTDPRTVAPNTGYTKPTGYTVPPTHLACEECHVTPKAAVGTGLAAASQNTRTNGWAGGNMTITAFAIGTDTKKSSGNWSATYAKSTVHTIPNSVGQINNWGICLGCHDGTTNASGVTVKQIQPIHGMPTNIRPTQAYCGTGTTYGLGQYLPGRTNFNDISNINYFGDVFRATTTDPQGNHATTGNAWGTVQCGNRTTGSIARRATTFYTNNTRANGRTYKNVAMPTTAGSPSADGQIIIPNPWTGTTHNTNTAYPFTGTVFDQIPTFASQTANAAVTKTATIDIVSVSSANWVGTTLTVTATVTNGVCADLTLVNAVGNVAFTGAGTCTAIRNGFTYPTNGRTIDVVSSQPDSVDVYAYPITDGNTPIPAAAVNDTATVAASGVTNLTVMANDSGTGISITSVTQPGLGSVAISGGTSIDYTGAGAGSTSFTYTITASDASTSTATVNVTATTDSTPPTVGTVSVTPTVTTYTSKAPVITATLTDAQSAVASCEYTTNNGTNWVAGVVSGAASPWTCTGSPTGLTGALTINVRGTSAGGLGTGAAVTRTVDTTIPTTGTLTVTPGNTQNGLSWTASTDVGLGLRASNTYDVRFLTGATAPTCSTGTSVYTGTALTTTHTALTNGTQYSYRVCAYDAADNVSTGATGSGTPTAVVPVDVTYYITPGTATNVGVDGSTTYTTDVPSTAPGLKSMLGTATANTAWSYRPTSGMTNGTWVTLIKNYSPVYATAKTITAGSAASFDIRGYNATDQWRCNIYAYNPAGAAGNKTLILTSSVVTSGTGGTVSIAPTYTGSGTIPAGYRLLMELDYKPGGTVYTPRIYNTASTFTVTQQ